VNCTFPSRGKASCPSCPCLGRQVSPLADACGRPCCQCVAVDHGDTLTTRAPAGTGDADALCMSSVACVEVKSASYQDLTGVECKSSDCYCSETDDDDNLSHNVSPASPTSYSNSKDGKRHCAPLVHGGPKMKTFRLIADIFAARNYASAAYAVMQGRLSSLNTLEQVPPLPFPSPLPFPPLLSPSLPSPPFSSP